MDSKTVKNILHNKMYVNNSELTEEIKNFTVKNIIDQGDGYVESLSNFGFLCRFGIGVKKDIIMAEIYYMKSIDLGGGHYPMNNLGLLYEYDLKDIENAIKWYTRAVEFGSSIAPLNLGCLYERKLKDLKNAEFWYKKAADTGSKKAIKKMKKFRKLNKIYLGNDGVNDYFKNNTCNICMDPLLGSTEIIIMICGHVYHKKCLVKNKRRCSLKCIP